MRDSDLNNLLDDAHRFVVEQAEGIGDSALHVYDSALLFTPHDTTFFKTFQHEFKTSVSAATNSAMSWYSPSNEMEYYSKGTYLSAFRNSIAWLQESAVRMQQVVVDGQFLSAFDWIKVSPDGTRFATRSLQEMRIWDTSTGKCIVIFDSRSSSAKFSPTSKYFISEVKTGVQLRDTITGKLIATFDCPTVSLLLFSPDGERIVLEFFDRATDGDHSLHLHKTATGRVITALGDGGINLVTFSPNSTRVVCPSSRGMRLWNATTGRHIAVLGCTSLVQFTPDSSRIIRDRVQVWDSATGSPIDTLEPHFTVNSSVKSQPRYSWRDAWVTGSFEGQRKRICCVPWVVRGDKPIASSGGNYVILGNERGEWISLDLSRVQWTN